MIVHKKCGKPIVESSKREYFNDHAYATVYYLVCKEKDCLWDEIRLLDLDWKEDDDGK